MKRRSEAGQRYKDEFEAMKPFVEARSGGNCECGQGCGRQGEVHHHRKRQSQGGPNTMDNLLHLSDHCHRHLHDNPSWAFDRGLLVRGHTPILGFWEPIR